MINYRLVLEANIDSGYKEFHEKLVPGIQNIRGVRSPVIKKLAKEIAKGDYAEFLKEKNFDYYEEKMLHGLVIGNLKLPFNQLAGYITDFVPYIDNWAVCDSFCSCLKSTRENKEEMLNIIEKYCASDKEYEIRFAIVMLMDYYLETKYLDKIFNFVNAIKHDGYYVKMGIAWAISTAFVKERERTLQFIADNSLESWTHNKAIQKIRESCRVSKDDKIMLKLMKK